MANEVERIKGLVAYHSHGFAMVRGTCLCDCHGRAPCCFKEFVITLSEAKYLLSLATAAEGMAKAIRYYPVSNEVLDAALAAYLKARDGEGEAR